MGWWWWWWGVFTEKSISSFMVLSHPSVLCWPDWWIDAVSSGGPGGRWCRTGSREQIYRQNGGTDVSWRSGSSWRGQSLEEKADQRPGESSRSISVVPGGAAALTLALGFCFPSVRTLICIISSLEAGSKDVSL